MGPPPMRNCLKSAISQYEHAPPASAKASFHPRQPARTPPRLLLRYQTIQDRGGSAAPDCTVAGGLAGVHVWGRWGWGDQASPFILHVNSFTMNALADCRIQRTVLCVLMLRNT